MFYFNILFSLKISRKDDVVKFLQRHTMDQYLKSIKYMYRDLMLKTM